MCALPVSVYISQYAADEGICCGCYSYICYLVFQLYTHHDLFIGEGEDEEPVMTLVGSLTALTAITALVALASE